MCFDSFTIAKMFATDRAFPSLILGDLVILRSFFPDGFSRFCGSFSPIFVRLGSSGDAVPFTFMWRSMGILAMLNRLISLFLPFLFLT